MRTSEDYENEISQLKKQLEEADQAMNDLMRAGNKTIANLKSKIEEKDFELNNYQTALTICQERESKLEVKEKPDFERLIYDRYGDMADNASFEDGCIVIWDEYVVSGNAVIAELDRQLIINKQQLSERDKEIEELKVKVADLYMHQQQVSELNTELVLKKWELLEYAAKKEEIPEDIIHQSALEYAQQFDKPFKDKAFEDFVAGAEYIKSLI